MANSSSLGASASVEYSEDASSVLTPTEREELCNFWECEEHFHGDEECQIKKAETKILNRAKNL